MDLVEYERRCPVHFREFKLSACSDFNTKQTAQSIRADLIPRIKSAWWVNFRIGKFRAKSLRSSLAQSPYSVWGRFFIAGSACLLLFTRLFRFTTHDLVR